MCPSHLAGAAVISTRTSSLGTLRRSLAAHGLLILGLFSTLSVAQAQTTPTSISLGNLSNDVQADYQTPSYSIEVSLSPNRVQWYSFTLTSAISNANGRYLDIDTYPNTLHHVDTTIGLYDSTGNRIGLSADGGPIFFSQLSYGLTSPARGPVTIDGTDLTADPAQGADGDLLAGTYYLAVTRFTSTFGDTGFDVTSNSNGSDTFLLQFRGQTAQAVPEPSTIALLALGLLTLTCQARRRLAQR